jgi:hypothetical protein
MVRSSSGVVILLLVLAAVALHAAGAENCSVPSNYDLVAENEYLQLYIDRSTTEVAVVDRLGCEVWYSNPIGSKTRANLTIGYYTPSDTLQYMNSYSNSVEYGQFEITPVENGVRIDYRLGKEWDEADLIPVMISQQRFEDKVLANLASESDRNTLLSKYQLVSLVPKTSADEDGEIEVYRVDLKKLFGDYKLVSPGRELTASQTKALIERLVDSIVANKQDYRTREQVTPEDVAHLKESPSYLLGNLLAWDTSKVVRILDSAGYTYEDAQSDHIANSIDPPEPSILVFDVPVDLRIEGSSFVASVPAGEITYPDRVEDSEGEIVSYPLYTLELFPYFGAAPSGERGYMLVPDGSGGLIYLDGDKSYATAYNQPVYGVDQSIMPLAVRTVQPNRITLPVFGMKNGDRAMVAMIEQGEAFASVRADVPRNNKAYSSVYPQFIVLPVGQIEAAGGVPYLIGTNVELALFNNYPDERYQGLMQVRYSFLSGEEANYVGMARRYQDYLVDRYGLQRVRVEDNMPFYLELIGGIDVNRPVLGAPRSVVEPMTTYTEALEIVGELLRRGVAGIRLKYTGWMRGGYRHIYPDEAPLEGKLGTRRDFQALVSYLSEHGVEFFPEVSLTVVYRNGLLDGFVSSRDTAFRLDTEMAVSHDYDLASNRAISGSAVYNLSPLRLDSLVDRFLSSYLQYGVKGIALRHMGSQVGSDFREKRTLDRQGAVGIFQQQMQKLTDVGLDIMVDGGNEYSLQSARHVLNLPLDASHQSKIVDESVPFYQIALHGFIDYAGNPLNYSTDYKMSVLKSIETGAYPFFQWIYRDNSVLKGTAYDYLMSVNYNIWIDRAVELYHEASKVLLEVQGQTIVDHQRILDGVYVTSYEGGARVVVNYNRQPVSFGDTEIEAQGFALIKEVK